jgi:hypothetical protein
MTLRRLFLMMLVAGLLMMAEMSKSNVLAQSSDQTHQGTKTESKDEETNLDTQLYLLVGTDQDVANAKLPATLDGVLKQLRSSLPFKNYRLAATLINRVSNYGSLNLRWIGGPLLPTGGAVSSSTPSFNEFRVTRVVLAQNAEGQQVVRMEGFNFGARIPISTASVVASNGNSVPQFNYENTGLGTSISMRDGEPVIVGTLNVGPSGEAIIVVMSARKTNK